MDQRDWVKMMILSYPLRYDSQTCRVVPHLDQRDRVLPYLVELGALHQREGVARCESAQISLNVLFDKVEVQTFNWSGVDMFLKGYSFKCDI